MNANFEEVFHRPKLKEHMQYLTEHPDEVNKIAKVKATLSDVKGIVIENIEKVCVHIFLFEYTTYDLHINKL